MRRAIVLLLAIAAVAAQRPPDESNVPESEKRIPPGHYCKSVPPGPRETNAHLCACEYSCTIDHNGNVTEHESDKCLSWCHVNGRHCTCWPEGDPAHPCIKEGGNAEMDMDGTVLAVAKPGYEAQR